MDDVQAFYTVEEDLSRFCCRRYFRLVEWHAALQADKKKRKLEQTNNKMTKKL